jgi:hypothetical protein
MPASEKPSQHRKSYSFDHFGGMGERLAARQPFRSTLTIDVWTRAAFRMGQQGTYCSKLALHKR